MLVIWDFKGTVSRENMAFNHGLEAKKWSANWFNIFAIFTISQNGTFAI